MLYFTTFNFHKLNATPHVHRDADDDVSLRYHGGRICRDDHYSRGGPSNHCDDCGNVRFHDGHIFRIYCHDAHCCDGHRSISCLHDCYDGDHTCHTSLDDHLYDANRRICDSSCTRPYDICYGSLLCDDPFYDGCCDHDAYARDPTLRGVFHGGASHRCGGDLKLIYNVS